MDNARRERLKALPHLAVSSVILLHGFSAFEAHPLSAICFLFFGLLCLVLAVFHHRIEHRWPYVPAVFRFIEGAVAVVVLIEHLHAGKKYLPYADVVAIAMCFVVGVIRLAKIRRSARIIARNSSPASS